ncbi:hypothetical protein [Vibrio sp. TBV020]|uniref:hypothetical protein n=1 Tax=Vibrio sp. TBV020 TaxID=3137398 RepID=UPI0038CD4EA8
MESQLEVRKVANMCNCHSYNKDIGDDKEVILHAPKSFGFTNPHGVCVDACIAPVIEHLWKKNIITRNSCCGHGRLKPSIIFNESMSYKDAVEIRSIIAEVDDREFDLLSWVLTNPITVEKLHKELEKYKAQTLVHAWDMEKLLVVMQSFYIELAQGNQDAANSWIINTLFGPGLIPENTEISAQEHFDNALKGRIETLDEAKAKLKQQSE